jgi:2-hydroxychromene-2-carboxylate isomerase
MMRIISTPGHATCKIPPPVERGLHRKIGGAFAAAALMVGTLAVVASGAAPTASAMKAECYAHVQAGRWAEAHGMYAEADLEYAAANACDDGY